MDTYRDAAGLMIPLPGDWSMKLLRWRRSDLILVPMLPDEAVFDADYVEVVPYVFFSRVGWVLTFAVPHHQHVGAVGDRQHRSGFPLWFDLLRGPTGHAAYG